MTTCVKFICTIPTVGFYRKHVEVSLITSSQNYIMILMRPPLMTLPPPTCRRLLSLLSACCGLSPQKGEFNSHHGDWCWYESDIVLKCVGQF